MRWAANHSSWECSPRYSSRKSNLKFLWRALLRKSSSSTVNSTCLRLPLSISSNHSTQINSSLSPSRNSLNSRKLKLWSRSAMTSSSDIDSAITLCGLLLGLVRGFGCLGVFLGVFRPWFATSSLMLSAKLDLLEQRLPSPMCILARLAMGASSSKDETCLKGGCSLQLVWGGGSITNFLEFLNFYSALQRSCTVMVYCISDRLFGGFTSFLTLQGWLFIILLSLDSRTGALLNTCAPEERLGLLGRLGVGGLGLTLEEELRAAPMGDDMKEFSMRFERRLIRLLEEEEESFLGRPRLLGEGFAFALGGMLRIYCQLQTSQDHLPYNSAHNYIDNPSPALPHLINSPAVGCIDIPRLGYGQVDQQIYSPMSESLGSSHSYQPYKYPPDYQLALLHQRCSMPGKPDLSQPPCPCCKQHPKIPFKNWWGRSIERDFKQYGGAIVSYFWLLKLYILAICVIMCIYGFYLMYLTQHYCDGLQDPTRQLQVCGSFYGLWVISNGDLHDLMTQTGDHDTVVRFNTLRTIVFLVLLATGIAALYVMRWFKVRYPDRVDISNFSLLFKNLPTPNLEDLITRLRSEFGEFEIKQGFIIKKIEPFYTAYQQKLEKFYQLKIQRQAKKQLKLQKDLLKLDKFCSQHEDEYHHCGRRAIIVFHSRQIRDEIFSKYKISQCENLKLFFNNQYSQSRQVYCEACPRPEQLLWNNLGKEESEGCKVKVKSVGYFFLSLLVTYLLLFFMLQVIYIDELTEPLKSVIQFVIMLVITAFALTFRVLMNKLSELRFPKTFTERTAFIVITTVAFHYLFYLFIPAIYLALEVDRRGDVLKCISNQTFGFVLAQVVLSSVDIVYCFWGRGRKKAEDETRPVGCQKLLHARIQYPRYPIEFKLIVTFKFWSLTTFFSFHTPIILLLMMLVLVFLYVKDKQNLYTHYRMEVIHNQVQINFLKLYTNIFVVFMFIIYISTQHSTTEYILGSVVASAAVLFQNIYFRGRAKKESEDDEEGEGPKTLDDLQPAFNVSYQERYNNFLEISRNDRVDKTIKEDLYGAGFSSINTDDEITAKFIN